MNIIQSPDLLSIVDEHYKAVCPKLNKPIKGRMFYENSVYEKINKKILDTNTNKNYLPVLNYLLANHERILTGTVEDLSRIVFFVEHLMRKNKLKLETYPSKNKVKKTELFEIISECFDYETYSGSNKPYRTLLKLGVSSCPYCNRQFINTYFSKSGKTRATLDHFYKKSRYPYLALSFFNLIPSCYSCNSSFKGNIKFTHATHMNPYHACFDSLVRFSINFKKDDDSGKYIAQFFANADFLKIEIKDLVDQNDDKLKRARGNITVFHLEDLYNFHKDYVVELLQKESIYKLNGYAKYLANNYPKLFNDEHDILKMLLGNYNSSINFNKRPLSRLTRDIAKELGFSTEIEGDLI